MLFLKKQASEEPCMKKKLSVRKRVLTVLCIAALAMTSAFMTGCGESDNSSKNESGSKSSQAENGADDDGMSWTTYSDEGYEISFDYPEGWTYYDDSEDGDKGFVIADGDKKHGDAKIAVHQTEVNTTIMSLSDESWKEIMLQSSEEEDDIEIKDIDVSHITLNGIKALEMKINGIDRESHPVESVMYIYNTNKYMYGFSVSYRTEMKEKYKPVADKIIDSLEISSDGSIKEDTPSWKTYSSKKLEISLDYPEEWTFEENALGDDSFAIYEASGSSIMLTQSDRETSIMSASDEKLKELFQAKLGNKNGRESEIHDVSHTTFDGWDAVKMTISVTDNKKLFLAGDIYIYNTDKHMYIIQAYYNDKMEDEYKPIVDRIVGSIDTRNY